MSAVIQENKVSSWRWPLIVVGLLTAHMSMMMFAVSKISADKNGVVIPNYYQKSLKWDETKAAELNSQQLGWTVVMEVGATLTSMGERDVAFKIKQADGKPVLADEIEVYYFQDAHAAEAKTVVIKATEPGEFRSSMHLSYAGFHHVTVRAALNSQAFVHSWTPFIAGGVK